MLIGDDDTEFTLLECHTNGSSNIAKPDTLKKEANFVDFIRNYEVYTSEYKPFQYVGE